jgi:hypothetical protein
MTVGTTNLLTLLAVLLCELAQSVLEMLKVRATVVVQQHVFMQGYVLICKTASSQQDTVLQTQPVSAHDLTRAQS